jgi:hypothetical protein
VERARRRGKRAAHGVVVVTALTFIGASALQIIPAVFATDAAPVGAPGAPTLPDSVCAGGMRRLVRALDRASSEAWTPVDAVADDDEQSPRLTAFQRALAPEWEAPEAIEHACALSPGGKDAWTALLRLRRAHEQALLRDRFDLVPLRRDVTSHLPAELR